MIQPEVVVFDLGKVLLDFDYSLAAKKLHQGCNGIHADEIRRLLAASPLLLNYESGLIDRRRFYHDVCAATGYQGTMDTFAAEFGDIFQPIQPMIDLQTELWESDVPTYIFSNTNDMAIEFIRRAYPFFSRFAGYILSYEEGSMKPASKMYASLERMAGKTGASVLYIDDRLENIVAGEERGWQVILHVDPVSTREKVCSLGLCR